MWMCCRTSLTGLCLAVGSLAPAIAAGQTGSALASQQKSSGLVRELTVDEAVRLALEQNLGIRVERLGPQIQDLAIAQSKALWAPTLTTDLGNTSVATPVANVFAGGQDKVTTSSFEASFGVTQRLSFGTDYSVSWVSSRMTSTNFFNTFDPQLRSNLDIRITQPLLRNFKIDDARQQLETTQKLREMSDVDVRTTISQTTRNVKNAYWDLVASIDNLEAQRQSLDLARRLLADNEKRVQIGTMAPIDIVEAQSEVARNDEAVIVAESAILEAQDRLRALIFDPSAPDFWTVDIEPVDQAPFEVRTVDVDAAVRAAVQNRTDVIQANNQLAQIDISIRYLNNQILPDINATASYGVAGIGGTRYAPLDFTSLPTGSVTRSVLSQRGFGSVLSDVFAADYPTWSVGIEIGYPIGTSTAEANLARARLQHSQDELRIRQLELQVATEVRSVARQVETNQKRIESARAAHELAERRLEAEEKKFAAGIQTSFFVFQAQRDLAQARTNEVRAILDYNKSLVDLEAVQEVPLR